MRAPLDPVSTWLTAAAAENNLSFIETSALDASNVESAFQTILTGASVLPHEVFVDAYVVADIYRIVSSKSLESSANPIEPPNSSVTVSATVDPTPQGNKCC